MCLWKMVFDVLAREEGRGRTQTRQTIYTVPTEGIFFSHMKQSETHGTTIVYNKATEFEPFLDTPIKRGHLVVSYSWMFYQ